MSNVQKAYAITDAKISFVSLVDKAANKRNFLITKQENGQASFSTYGRIVKTDASNHYITGIVYEPFVEDAHGNFMTEEEITKAAYWFAKNGDSVDIQHSFEKADGISVVENWVAKADFTIGEETVKKGTWLMTAEVTDDDVWAAVEKGEITGFSMGGVGKYSEEDTDLENGVEKATEPEATQTERKGIFKKLASLFGFDVVEKGAMKDIYEARAKSSNFWNAFYTLEDMLYRYDNYTGHWDFEQDETVIREALSEFSTIVQDILAADSIAKAIESCPVIKSGRQLSAKNKESLKNIYDTLGNFLSEVDNEQEETEMTKAEVQAIVDEAVKKAFVDGGNGGDPAPAEKAPEEPTITAESVQKMVDEAVKKALAPQEQEADTKTVAEMVEEAVKKAVEPILKSRALPSNLGGNDGAEVKKSEDHYLHGIL